MRSSRHPCTHTKKHTASAHALFENLRMLTDMQIHEVGQTKWERIIIMSMNQPRQTKPALTSTPHAACYPGTGSTTQGKSKAHAADTRFRRPNLLTELLMLTLMLLALAPTPRATLHTANQPSLQIKCEAWVHAQSRRVRSCE